VTHVLVVEDDPVLRDLMREYLESLRYTVMTAADGVEGLRRALEEDFDLVMCDLSLPKLSGEELCDRLIEQRPEMASHILVVTGDILGEEPAEFLRRTGLPYAQKPFGLSELSRILRDVLERKAPSDSTE